MIGQYVDVVVVGGYEVDVIIWCMYGDVIDLIVVENVDGQVVIIQIECDLLIIDYNKFEMVVVGQLVGC